MLLVVGEVVPERRLVDPPEHLVRAAEVLEGERYCHVGVHDELGKGGDEERREAKGQREID